MLIAAVGWGLTTFLLPETIRFFSKDGHSVEMIAFARVLNGAFQGN